MILHQPGFWLPVFSTEMQRIRVAMAKFEFHVHKAEVENVFIMKKERSKSCSIKSNITYMCIHGIP